jgi:hypothetical protein
MRKMLGLAAMALALAACGGSSGGGGSGNTTLACNVTSAGGCFEWTAPESSIASVQAAFNASCTNEGGSAVSACSSTSRVGKCTVTLNEGTTRVTIVSSLYSPTYTAATAQQECTSSGVTFSN